MGTELQLEAFLGHGARRKTVVRVLSLSAANGERVGMRFPQDRISRLESLNRRQGSAAVLGCEFRRRLAASSIAGRDALRTRRRDACATRFMERCRSLLPPDGVRVWLDGEQLPSPTGAGDFLRPSDGRRWQRRMRADFCPGEGRRSQSAATAAKGSPDPDNSHALFAVLETQNIIAGEANITLIPRNSELLGNSLPPRRRRRRGVLISTWFQNCQI